MGSREIIKACLEFKFLYRYIGVLMQHGRETLVMIGLAVGLEILGAFPCLHDHITVIVCARLIEVVAVSSLVAEGEGHEFHSGLDKLPRFLACLGNH